MRLCLSGTDLGMAEGVRPLVDACLRLGIDSVELWYPQNTDLLGWDASIELLTESGIAVACVGTATELGGEGDVTHAQGTIITAVRLAAGIGCPLVNTYFGWRSERDDAQAVDAYRRNLAPCLREAERAGVAIALENEFDGFGHDPLGTDPTRRPEALARLVATVGSELFRVTFDPCNALFAGIDPRHMVEYVEPYVAQIHVKDGFGFGTEGQISPGWQRFSDRGEEYSTCALGEGEVDWADLLSLLTTDHGYVGPLTLEPHSVRDLLDEAWDRAAAFMRRTLGEAAG